MMLTSRSRFAVAAVVAIATKAGNDPVKLSEIAEQNNIALNYLEQIFSQLKDRGVVKSIRGPGGGYVLAVPVNQLTMLQVLEATAENIHITRCDEGKTCMGGNIHCQMHYIWKATELVIKNYFSTITIADIVNGSAEKEALLMLEDAKIEDRDVLVS